MNKYFVCTLFVCFLLRISNAQMVSIPDSNFRKALKEEISLQSCFTSVITQMDGKENTCDLLNTKCIRVQNLKKLNLSNRNIRNLECIQYFTGLISLDISYNLLKTIPSLSSNLKELICNDNQLDVLPTLPKELSTLNCINNKLKKLPELPITLIKIDTSGNQFGFK